ncbi:Putative cytochrome c-type biogenesis protein [Halomicronema hongdechloris C2206]|uniref:Cytochrome c-type biogenesis protein n=1 Tax=Halomicronema hongdechloris C2206 TaxID=1641165 RepID=A0A1Z3HUP5_9CYAN|nr:cytochrome c biogenesis protein CcdA [Halomicronema hongdechloris]ASC74041.1 Putative cytochrome c-type biogenesis protein [Halomicronema hongdechloris C2206]
MLETLQTDLYSLSLWADHQVAEQLAHVSGLSLGILLLAGLLTSLSPCMLSMLPIMVGYMGGYDAKHRGQALLQASGFALGLATTLAILGLIAGGVGRVYGQVGWGLPILVSVVAILMGLNLLQALPLPLPSLGNLTFLEQEIPVGVKAYLLGLTFGVVASPCSTPVLATLLAWIASTEKPLLGGIFLLTYTIGYVFPVLLAGTFTATLKQLLQLRRWSGWITPTSGVLLVGFGVFSLLLRLLPTALA